MLSHELGWPSLFISCKQIITIAGYPIIRRTTYAHPSPYAELLTTPSIGADMGTTAPCSTGFANTGVLRLGNRCGRRVWSAVPTVCGCVEPLLLLLDGCREGGSGDCTNLSDGVSESGGRGRKKRMGTLRKGWVAGGRRMLEMRWKDGRSTAEVSSPLPLSVIARECTHPLQQLAISPTNPPLKDS